MELLREITEDEMILSYLKAEIKSSRFKNEIELQLKKLNINKSIITNPRISDVYENSRRKEILNGYRKYSDREDYFEGFPLSIDWGVYRLSKIELSKILYIDYDYWNLLSDGTRLSTNAAKNIKNGLKVYGQSTDVFLEITEKIKTEKTIQPMILLKSSKNEKMVVFEGHARLTAYSLMNFEYAEYYDVIIGIADSSEVDAWIHY
jgi:hypothetical protein